MNEEQRKFYYARLAERKAVQKAEREADLEIKELLAKKKTSLSPEQYRIFLNNEILNTLNAFKTKEGKDNAKKLTREYFDRKKKEKK